jgi:hypothetical protein
MSYCDGAHQSGDESFNQAAAVCFRAHHQRRGVRKALLRSKLVLLPIRNHLPRLYAASRFQHLDRFRDGEHWILSHRPQHRVALLGA